MRTSILVMGVAGLTLVLLGDSAQAAIAGLERVALGLNFPVFATHAPGDNNRLFVLEQGGNVKIVDLNTNSVSGTFLNISDTDAENEGGLLGLAFHPNYQNNGKFYVYVTVDNDLPETTSPFTSRIREYTVSGNPDVADPGSVTEVLSFTQPQSNHNAGWIGFGPNDGYLYVMSGDGGGGFDNAAGHSTLPDAPGNAQDVTNNFLGKALRIDINGDDFGGDAARNYAIPATNPFKAGVGAPEDDFGDDEIWAYGLRNPYRASFDRLTGDLWIGDVGQNQLEEVDFQPASSAGGENYGWRFREGNLATLGGVGGPDSDDYTDPVYYYGRGTGAFLGETVTGGYIYRGPDPDLQGLYFFADSFDDNAWTFDPDGVGGPFGTRDNINAELGALFPSVNRIVSYGEDLDGNLYLVDYGTFSANTGEVYRILTDKLFGDYDDDGDVDEVDFGVWRAAFGLTGVQPADGNGDGIVDGADYTVWRDHFGLSINGAGSGAGSAAVPEPGTIILVAQLLCVLVAAVRYNRM